MKYNINKLPKANDNTEVSGIYRCSPQDFVVVESLGFEPTGEGEHAFLTIQKEGRNTEDVARTLAHHANIPRKAVSYAGLKDRKAVTTQYFSVHLPGQPDPDWSEIADSGISVLAVTRHQKKLKRGALKKNHFQLMIRNISGVKDRIEQRLQHIGSNGVPNYFMSQRFGHNAANLDQADDMLVQGQRVKDRFKRTMYYSAARSWLFNQVLADRITAGNWKAALDGDAMMLTGSRSCFYVDTVDDEIKKRVS
jgi:tRNA pseudouridine13 synthase